jgi:hypothetical protein
MDQLKPAIRKAIFEVFERMFFIFPEEPDDPLPAVALWRKIAIMMAGTENLTLTCFFPYRLGVRLTENYLGMGADEVTEQLIEETIKEAVNVVAGNFLAYAGRENVLGLPVMAPPGAGDDPIQLTRNPGTLALMMEEDLFLTCLTATPAG